MARKKSDNVESAVESSATPDVAAANFQSAQRSQVQAAVEDGNVVVDGGDLFDNEFTPETNQDGKITQAAAEARNTAALARGEEPVVDDVEEVNLDIRAENNQGDILPEDVAAEDTMAVRQSNVDRIVDNEIQRAEGKVDNLNVTSDSPSVED